MKKVLNLVKKKKESTQNAGPPSSPNLSKQRGSIASVASAASAVLKKTSSYPDGGGGASKLHLAVFNENVEKVKKIVSKNDVHIVNATDSGGRTPLHLAAEKGMVGIQRSDIVLLCFIFDFLISICANLLRVISSTVPSNIALFLSS